MEQQLLQLLADTQSTAPAIRQAAEVQLLTLYPNDAFALSLASIASHKSVPTNLRQSALLILRTFVNAAWSPQLDDFKGSVLVTDPNKATLRRVLLDLATTADPEERKVKASASYVVSKIASADFPEEWPELLPTLLAIIPNSGDVQLHGALKVLLDLVESGFSEEQFFKVARELVSTVFTVATNSARKPVLRALAVSVFRACFDTLEMVMEEHKVAVKQFLDEALSGWSPFFIATMKEPLPTPPSEEDEAKEGPVPEEWRGVIALKLQVVKTLMKIRAVFPALLTPQSTTLFSTVWTELSTIHNAYQELFILDERQGRLEDADGLPYTLDFLVLEELDLMQALLRAPPVKAELQSQLQAAGAAASTTGWLPEVMKLVVSYVQITTEEEGLWDIDINLYLSEETSLTANYTPRTCGGDLVIKLGEWLKGTAVEGLLAYTNSLFADSNSSWKMREAALFVLNQLLRDFYDVEQQISLDLANGFNEFVRFCLAQENFFLRARGYLVAGILARTTDEGFHQTAMAHLDAALNAITADPSEVVQVACIRVLQDFLPALPSTLTKPLQVRIITALSDFISALDLREMLDSDDLKFALLDSLRDAIMIDPSAVTSSIALDVLFNIASNGASNFQLATIVTETFEDVVQCISQQGQDAYIQLCEKVLPSLTGAIDVGNMTQEKDLTALAADLIRALTEHSLEPLPQGFVATIMPKLNRLLLSSKEGTLLPAATIAVKNMLHHDPTQFLAWQDPHTGKGAVEVVLIIVDYLLSQAVDDNAAEEVGGLAAELVEKAGSEKLGPYLTQLLHAVANRLATAEKAQFIQSLILVFARLSLISPREVLDFLSTLSIGSESGLSVVFSKWLENSVNFAGYDEIRQNVIALAKIYQLNDPRLAQVQVKGELIIKDTGRIKTRSQARNNPDEYTIIPAPLKIIKVLAEELVSATGNRELDPSSAAAQAALDEAGSDDENDDWEDIPASQTLDLGLGITKQELMGYAAEDGAGGSVFMRQRDDETLAFLMGFFREVAAGPGFQEVFNALNAREQEALRGLGTAQTTCQPDKKTTTTTKLDNSRTGNGSLNLNTSKRKASADGDDETILLELPERKVLKNGTMQSSPKEIVDMSTHPEIDESLYSRQLYVLGHEAMKRMGSSNILIAGLKGLGAEIAKNIALAGVKSLALYDPTPVAISDLSSQFFLNPQDVGRPRAEATAPHVAELNAYTPVSIHQARNLTDDLSQLNKYQVVVLTDTPLKDQLTIAEYCHKNNIFVIITDTFGLFGYIFTDFGENFTVVDATGEEPVSGIVAGIDEEGLVSASDEARHGLGEDDYVTFTEVKGMEALNNSEPRKVDIKGPYTFSIGDVSGLGTYKSGGIYTQVKMPKIINFKPFAEQLKEPEILVTDFTKFDRPAKLHVGIQALHKFAEAHGGKFPRPHNDADAKEVIKIASELGEEVDEKLLTELSYQAQGDLSPMAAFFGGLAAQEVLKAVSGKFHPVVQWYYFDSLESLPASVQRSEEECKPRGTRYDGQIAVFGNSFQKKISEVKEFLVGSGAIGCEMLKNWAMIGLATGEGGKITVTDMDQIETSNLNRQFLFRPRDVGKLKSDCAAEAVQKMNPELKGKIVSLKERVGAESEHIFNEDFWESLDGVTNALDNVDARTYIDRRCVFFRKPLLESGTLGTKGNTQVILPWLTESYSSSQDPPEQSFPMCTLRSFPNRIEHTIAWARELFQTSFVGPAENVNMYLSQPDYIKTTLKQSGNEKQTLEILRDFLVTDKPLSFDDCIVWARQQFEANFNNAIQQLLYNFPKDSVTSSGTPFWSGPKRAPTPLKFDPTNPTHFSFIVAGANLHAFNYGIKNPGVDKGHIRKVLEDMIIPEFTPSSGVKIQANENEPDPNAQPAATDEQELQQLVAALPPPSSLAGVHLEPVEFEKDDDTNHHIDFITAASNLRAANYDIQQADRHKTKFIAGKIIPAIATTTALVTGLVILELYKIIDGKPHTDQYKNSFVNLALPFFSFIDPIESPMDKYKHKGRDVHFHKLWDRFEADDVLLKDFLKSCEEENGLDVSMISSGVSLLYPVFNKPQAVIKKRLEMKLSELVQSVSDKPIPDHQKYVIFEFLARDETDEDVDIPYVSVKVDKPAKKDEEMKSA
ncbi:hypothetical protein FQN53_002404 [Emmonsiellopsis sp. PD_33]|nr:hypothetical protein FQN53_002404 [Emmonsiellopsis sp. PD_33]